MWLQLETVVGRKLTAAVFLITAVKANRSMTVANKKWYHKEPSIIVLLVLFFPAGVYLMLRYTKWNNKLKAGVTIGCAILALIIASSPPENQKLRSNNKSNENEVAAQRIASQKAAEEEATKQAAAQKARQDTINEISPIYCRNHKNILMSEDDQLKTEGWPVFQGRRSWSNDECILIISKLFDSGSSREQLLSISESKVWIGMSFRQLLYSWGAPNDINTTAVAGTKSHQLVYGGIDASYVYVEDGLVTAYQL